MTPRFDPQAVVLRLRAAVERQGTIPEVAIDCGLKEATLAHVLKGQNLPNTTTLVCLCNGLKVSADWLLFGELRS